MTTIEARFIIVLGSLLMGIGFSFLVEGLFGLINGR
jgi:hypothetical protein